MYQIINNETGVLMTETLNVTFVRQQQRVDRPIIANNIKEADGVVFYIGDEEYQLGLAKEYAEGEPNMLNYTPLVRVVEVSGEPYIMQQIEDMQAKVNAMQAQSTTTGEQVAEMYAVQTGDVVSKNELDAAYREGVNSVG